MINIEKKINKFLSRKLEIENSLSNSGNLDSKTLTELSKELSEVKVVTSFATELEKKKKELHDLEDLLKDKNSELELKEMAKVELKSLNENIAIIQKELEIG